MCHVLARGLLFEFDLGAGALCSGYAHAQYTPARTVLRFDDHSRDLILGFKHADRTELAPTLAGWMAQAGAALIEHADIMAPVPLHRLRLLRQRYNRASLLANVGGAFAVSPARRDRARGRRVVLIDDVMTTGAAVASCIRSLLPAGIAEVSVLTLAPVVRSAIEPI